MKTKKSFSTRWLWLALIGSLGLAISAGAGSYRDSAHGNASYGVDRSAIDAGLENYATGNCAHCHEMHSSMGGTTPLPAGDASPYALFAPGFNRTKATNTYTTEDVVCFYCHGNTGPAVVNESYSVTFGGGATGTGPQSVMEAFNLHSYHNLKDIDTFLSGHPSLNSWYAGLGNPCSACHDPHRVQRNRGVNPGSAITQPGSGLIWGLGIDETMYAYSAGNYEAPYAYIGGKREPQDVEEDPDGSTTPDYVSFCTTCHNTSTSIYSTDLGRNLTQIDWNTSGDKHGKAPRDGAMVFREPYQTAFHEKSNIVLTCLNCHEPHGSNNVALLRSRINGEPVEETITDFKDMGWACRQCHMDDHKIREMGINTQIDAKKNGWEYVHHYAPDAPYAGGGQCGQCHVGGFNPPKLFDCKICHGHGMDDSWLLDRSEQAAKRYTGRKTF